MEITSTPKSIPIYLLTIIFFVCIATPFLYHSIFCISYCAEFSCKDIILNNFPFIIQLFYHYFSYDPGGKNNDTDTPRKKIQFLKTQKSVVNESPKPPITTLLLTYFLTYFLSYFLTYLLSLMDEPLPGIPSEFWQKAPPPCSSAD